MRIAIRLTFLAVAILLISPFLFSSLLVDRRGVTIQGHVVAKHENIFVHYASWTRNLDVSVQYDLPDRYGSAAYLNNSVSVDRFDRLKKGDAVPLHYLLPSDLPGFPGAKTMRQMHLLPTVRFANETTWSAFQAIYDENHLLISSGCIILLVLLVWRFLRIPLFGWAVAACVAYVLVASVVDEFPRPTAAPQNKTRAATGTVKSVERIDWLFRSNQHQGLPMLQPIQIVGVQFIPEGRSEPVVAADMIDAESLAGIAERARVTLDYEKATPRIAYLRGATRHFPQRNLRGAITILLAMLAIVIALLAIGRLLSRSFRKLVERRA